MASSAESNGEPLKEAPERATWSGRLDFIFSSISYSVGLGNIWRFPYLCYRNGGAVFVFAYLFFLALVGIPLFFIEVSMSQFSSSGPTKLWRISPLFQGVGYCMLLVSVIVCVYYNIIIAWTLFYLIQAFFPVPPWSSCDNPWNTDRCVLRNRPNVTANASDPVGIHNSSGSLTQTEGDDGKNRTKLVTSSEEFWNRRVLHLSDGIEDIGGVRWELFGLLILAWVIVFLCLIKGIKSSGKVVYFTAVFPYVVFSVLLVRAVTLPGALDGIKYYVIPQWHKMATLQIWAEAAMQIFFSMGAGWGAIITMASYNKFHNNCYRDAVMLPMLSAGTSVLVGFIMFAIVGFMAHETGSSVDNVIDKGPGLVFVVYPEALAKLPVAQLWTVLFFSMLLSVGVGSQIGMVQTLTSAFQDESLYFRRHAWKITAAVCTAQFLLGIPCVTNGGIYVLQIMDWYSSTFSLMIIAFAETFVIAWIYGLENFYKDVEFMIGYRPCRAWKVILSVVTPSATAFIFVFNVASHTPVTYGDYSYPYWAIGIGWVCALSSLVPLPVCFFLKLRNAKGSLMQRVREQLKPATDWGPALAEDRHVYSAMLKQTQRDTELTV